MAPINRSGSGGFHTLLLGVVLVCIIAGLVTVTFSQLADALAPKVGDIISFEHVRGDVILSQEQVLATRVGGPSAAQCILDGRVLRVSGGSIVIEAIQLRPQRTYRVHWAGFHTSIGDADCGAVADLLVTRVQLAELISASGRLAIASEKGAYNGSPWNAPAF